MPLKIEEVYMWVLADENGDEGIPAVMIGGSWIPAVGADAARVLSMRPEIEMAARATGNRPRLMRAGSFEEIKPESLKAKLQ